MANGGKGETVDGVLLYKSDTDLFRGGKKDRSIRPIQ